MERTKESSENEEDEEEEKTQQHGACAVKMTESDGLCSLPASRDPDPASFTPTKRRSLPSPPKQRIPSFRHSDPQLKKEPDLKTASAKKILVFRASKSNVGVPSHRHESGEKNKLRNSFPSDRGFNATTTATTFEEQNLLSPSSSPSSAFLPFRELHSRQPQSSSNFSFSSSFQNSSCPVNPTEKANLSGDEGKEENDDDLDGSDGDCESIESLPSVEDEDWRPLIPSSNIQPQIPVSRSSQRDIADTRDSPNATIRPPGLPLMRQTTNAPAFSRDSTLESLPEEPLEFHGSHAESPYENIRRHVPLATQIFTPEQSDLEENDEASLTSYDNFVFENLNQRTGTFNFHHSPGSVRSFSPISNSSDGSSVHAAGGDLRAFYNYEYINYRSLERIYEPLRFSRRPYYEPMNPQDYSYHNYSPRTPTSPYQHLSKHHPPVFQRCTHPSIPPSSVPRELEKVKHLSGELVTTTKHLGSGFFGHVWSGYVQGLLPGHPTCLNAVAIKISKGSHQRHVSELSREIHIMKQLDHPNLIRLYGACTLSSPAYLVMELVPGGMTLREYLSEEKRQKVEVVYEDALDLAAQVASGMIYLHQLRILHRDLASRNCLMDSSRTVKISDFGLSIQLPEGETQFRVLREEAGTIPFKTSAPESISRGSGNPHLMWTFKSDVWAMGILLFEFFSGGDDPFEGEYYYGPRNPAYESVSSSSRRRGLRRLPPLPSCPPMATELMTKCCSFAFDSRPSFLDLHKSLLRLKRSPNALHPIGYDLDMFALKSEDLGDLSCCICKNVFNNPHVIKCGHSFCLSCITTWVQVSGGTCPVDRTLLSLADLNPCLGFKNMILKLRVSCPYCIREPAPPKCHDVSSPATISICEPHSIPHGPSLPAPCCDDHPSSSSFSDPVDQEIKPAIPPSDDDALTALPGHDYVNLQPEYCLDSEERSHSKPWEGSLEAWKDHCLTVHDIYV